MNDNGTPIAEISIHSTNSELSISLTSRKRLTTNNRKFSTKFGKKAAGIFSNNKHLLSHTSPRQ